MAFSQANDQLYQAYLVRLWRNRTDASWRVSLQVAADQSELHFSSIAHFVQFLEAAAKRPSAPDLKES